MKTMLPRPWLALPWLIFAAGTLPAAAGIITIKPGEGNAPAMLFEDAQTFTDAVRDVVRRQGKIENVPIASNKLNALRAKVQKTTLARIEYTYEKDGTTRTRTYHARSGHSIETMTEPLRRIGGRESSTSEPTSEGSSEDGPVSEAEDIVRDASESPYYRFDATTDVRVSKLPTEDSILEAITIDDKSHAWDAELKALRGIEADINAGVVEPGGNITGYVSKSVCASCEKVIETFADRFDVNGTLFHLIEPGPGDGHYNGDTEIGRSRKAASELAGMRKAYIKQELSSDALKNESPNRLANDAPELLEAEEAGREVNTDLCNTP